jgi:hypothetical protein
VLLGFVYKVLVFSFMNSPRNGNCVSLFYYWYIVELEEKEELK